MITRRRKENTQGARLVLALLTALCTVGCTGHAKPRALPEPIQVPEAWQASADQESTSPPMSQAELATWWQQLEDPILDQWIQRTIAGNLDLETALVRVEEARARRGLARSELGPTVSTSWGVGRTESLDDQGFSNDSFSASLDLAWEADLFGAKRLSLAASQADLEAEVENLHAVQIALIAETVVAYTDLREAEARLRVLDKSLRSREETAQLVQWREQAGLASRLEANQARSSLSQARAGRPANEQLVIEARLRLNLLAGEVPGALDAVLDPPDSQSALPLPPESVSVGIPVETLRQRPDVRRTERQLEAAVARLGAADAGRYPTLRLTGSLDAQSNELEELFDVDSIFANLLAGLTAPIFESGRIRQNIAVREAQVEQTALEYRSTVLEALSEVERALSFFQTSQERIEALEEAVKSAGEAAELADQRYEAGLVDLLSVLDTQRTLFSTEEQLVLAQGDLLNAFSNLYRALGGGWDSVPQELDAKGGTNA